MNRSIGALVLGTVVAFAGCGGADTGPPMPLVSGSLAGDYKGHPFTPMFGFATLDGGSTNVIALGDGPLNCASPQQQDPPSGTNAVFSVPALEAGTYSNRVVTIYRNVGSFEGYGTNSGSVMLTAVTETSVAGSIQYNHTNDVAETFSLSGTFEVTRCPN